MSKVVKLPIDKIQADGDTQLRAAESRAAVDDYAEALLGGATFPPIVVFFDGEFYWPGDGNHRLAAHRKAGKEEIDADVRPGSKRDAILFAAGANADHGLRRTNEDKRRAVLALLHDPEWRQWSDHEIAARARVDHKTVGNIAANSMGIFPLRPSAAS